MVSPALQPDNIAFSDIELDRLRCVRRLELLDKPEDPSFLGIVELTTKLLDLPMAVVSLLDESRQWFLARQGIPAREIPREMAFCTIAQSTSGLTVIPDTLEDDRFSQHPLVKGPPHIRFYAGHSLYSSHGVLLGSLCVTDQQPRVLGSSERSMLTALAGLVEEELRLRELLKLCPLTRVYQRVCFLRLAEAELQQSRRSNSIMVLALISIDGLTEMNEKHGFSSGDHMLKVVAGKLRRECSASSVILGRTGSHSFGILYTQCDLNPASAVKHISQQVAEFCSQLSTDYPLIHFYSGVSATAPHDGSALDLFYRAEQASAEALSAADRQVVVLLGS